MLGKSSSSTKKLASRHKNPKYFFFWLFIIPLILTVLWLPNCINPTLTYPSLNLKETQPYPMGEGTSAIFVDAPVNTKTRIKVAIGTLDARKIIIDSRYEIALSEENATFRLKPFKFMPYEKIEDLEAVFSDQPLKLTLQEINGSKWYIMPATLCEGGNVVNSLHIRYVADRMLNYSRLLQVPFLFDKDHYAPLIHIPILSVPVQKDNISDTAKIDVSIDTPYHRLFREASGWMAMRIPLEREILSLPRDGDVVRVPRFEFPIEQQYHSYDHVFSFTTRFSRENLANRVSLVFVPDYVVYALALSFLWSGLVLFKKTKTEKTSFMGGLGKIMPYLKVYSIPFLILGAKSIHDGVYLFGLLEELVNLMGLFATLIFFYPALFVIAYVRIYRAT